MTDHGQKVDGKRDGGPMANHGQKRDRRKMDREKLMGRWMMEKMQMLDRKKRSTCMYSKA